MQQTTSLSSSSSSIEPTRTSGSINWRVSPNPTRECLDEAVPQHCWSGPLSMSRHDRLVSNTRRHITISHRTTTSTAVLVDTTPSITLTLARPWYRGSSSKFFLLAQHADDWEADGSHGDRDVVVHDLKPEGLVERDSSSRTVDFHRRILLVFLVS